MKNIVNFIKENLKTILFSTGMLMTLAYLANIWVNDDCWWSVIIDVIAMIGSGLLCSAIVSYVFEKQNEKMVRTQNEKALKVLLLPTTRKLVDLARELLNVIKKINMTAKESNLFQIENETYISLMEKVRKEFQQIEKDVLTPTVFNNGTISTEEINYNKRINEINICIKQANQQMKQIQNEFNSLYSDYNYIKRDALLHNIVDEKQICALEELLRILSIDYEHHYCNLNYSFYHKFDDVLICLREIDLKTLNLNNMLFSNKKGYLEYYSKKLEK